MGAQATQGVGPGDCYGLNKGSYEMTLGTSKLIGSRTVTAGSAVMVTGTPSTVVVTFPQPLTTVTGYGVMLTPVVASAASAPTGSFAVFNLTTAGFTIVGPNANTQTVNWSLVSFPNAAISA